MPKMTAKYSSALAVARKLKLSTSGNQEMTYHRLMDAGYFWNGKTQEWECLANEPAEVASPLLRVRVWASLETVQEQAKSIGGLMTTMGYQLVEMSPAYVCRPPKQNEGRVYLTFLK